MRRALHTAGFGALRPLPQPRRPRWQHQSWRTLSTPEDSALAILPPKTGFCMRRLERDSCPSLLIPHSPFPVLPTRSDSARPLSTHSASGQDSSPSFRFCLIDLILSVRFSPYQILSRGCGFCLRMPEREFSALPADFLATRPDSRFLIPVFARRGAVARPAGHLGMLTQPITLMCTRRILRATHFAIEVRSALRTVQSLLNGGSSHVRQRSHGRWHGGARAVRGRS